jgi:predicted MPP superfamily phosphohydrolase
MTRFSFVLFFSVFISVLLGMHYYVFTRIANGLVLIGALRLSLRLLFIFGAVSFFLSEFLMRRTEWPLAKLLTSFSMSWLGIIAMALVVLVFADVLRIFFHAPVFRYYATIGALAVLFVMTAYSIYNVAVLRDIKEIKLQVPRLPAQLSGFSVVQLSDVHINSLSSTKWIERIVNETNALKPDLIVITGDLVDIDLCRFPHFCQILRGLKAKYGVYAITGNHEYYTGVDRFMNNMENLNIKVLRNGRAMIANAIELVGIDDPVSALKSGAEETIKESMAGIDVTKPSILLAHRPDTFDVAAKLGFDLQLSGHTHAGQIPPMDLIVLMYFKYPCGLYTIGNSHCYVTTGTGYWGPPMRIFSKSEIVKFTLTNK